jgi:hypothetical protein
MQKKSSSSGETDSEINRDNLIDNGFVVIREAKVTQTTSRQANNDNSLLPSSGMSDANVGNVEEPFNYHETISRENGHQDAATGLNR